VSAVVTAVEPPWALPGGKVAIVGGHFPLPLDGPPHVLIDSADARVVAASSHAIRVIVPPGGAGGSSIVRLDELPGETAQIVVGRVFATDVHQVDSPAFDRLGRLVVTHSGGRDTKMPVPLYRIGQDGAREALAVEIANPTSLALGPDGLMYVSSRFDGNVYRLTADDRQEMFVTEVGVPTGLAFAPDGTLFIGDRSGSILRVSPDRHVDTFASLPPSVAAFHLAYGPDHCVYVAAPTLSTHDALYRISPDRMVSVVTEAFGRPQGLAFDSTGTLYVVDALAGAAGLYRLDVSQGHPAPVQVLSAQALIGVAFDPAGGVALASSDTIWKLDVDLKPYSRTPGVPGLPES
jgi:sugar lactone lactonase YvrE